MTDSTSITRVPGADGDHVTYCRICEALCGLIARVEGGKIVRILPDRANPHSRGHICVKGPALADVAYDPDRVTAPLKRIGGPGEFAAVSWDEALDEIAGRLSASIESHGANSFAVNAGNPPSMGWPSSLAAPFFQAAMGASRMYSPASEDISSVVLATELMFGTHAFLFPDLAECDHLLIFGSNPLVSHGSLVIAPRFKEDLDQIAKRGRVLVIDPRHTETARKHEHVPIIPGGDVWLIGAMLNTLIEENLIDSSFIAAHASGMNELAAAMEWLTPEVAAPRCGIAAETIRTMARDFAIAPRAAAMGRIGICRGEFATLTNLFVHMLNVIAGKFHRPGGYGWGHGGTASDTQYRGISPGARHGAIPSRVSGLPSVWGAQASVTFLEEMLTPGEGQIRSLLVVGANPVMSMPGGPDLPKGFAQLDLMVALDLYITETTRHADFVLPVTTALEREDINLFFMNHMVRPFAQHVDAVIPPVGDARMEFDILRDLAARMGRAEAFGKAAPFEMADAALRAGVEGRNGLSVERLRAAPHGMMIEGGRWDFDFTKRLGHADGKIHFWSEPIAAEIARLRQAPAWNPSSLRLINLRKLRSINSWMHNVEGLVRSDRASLLMHPDDAMARGIEDGGKAELSTSRGRIVVNVEISKEMLAGVVCYPHGWGHEGGWQRARATDGANLNMIAPAGPQSAERLSGMSNLEGFAVEVRALA
ncbi:molybdopterin-containing oxidoreductase family protein [Novosphingobium taihuense]|uniref:Formate dehydrogenase n=1 Tax=Novosphingobium taihuense TaxID=260085 RepID=A0A7W7EV86_9SPHN|nr:molybdopterin-dependent oxidoreductase [Novosphingobium taihuense]MBB4613025.1 formate dehydrogenase [Novosphingobium taihuense]TWH85169.1 formate dehydrogenase [Novosphingobium taihuense]